MLIEAERLSRCYARGASTVNAVDGVSVRIGQGEFVAVMGPSGSGKTTLMNLLGLLDRPSSGILRLAGENVAGQPDDRLAALRNRHIGFVFQNYNLLPRCTAVENVELPLVYAGCGRRERRRRAVAALEAFGLGHRLDHWPAELSGGEQQRVAIARAVVAEPDLVLADEPTGAVDSATGTDILALFRELHRSGRTVIVVTHDEAVARWAGRVLRLRDGVLQSERPLPAAASAQTGADDRPYPSPP
jgi:putative ABC transport system ATP-binding protein